MVSKDVESGKSVDEVETTGNSRWWTGYGKDLRQ